MCTTRQEYRREYQLLFEHRLPRKTYEAVGRYRSDLSFPLELSSHLVKRRDSVLAEQVPDVEPNAHTLVELIDHREHPVHGPIARYRVSPRTGKTHQIRVHMASAGIGIANDPLYPELLDQSLEDFSRPLQLLARELRFTDPFDHTERVFTSSRTLDAWR